ncbi:hypothetical protein DOTSEDRAFT_25526 [Dothistroma septosporum NZE10]|uniref:Uncharacterized protein n=1 Tax=Dothistroma septosporum (strain NZE10 / CBS 128990) TaxID=675120 RepID=M2WNL4_DOTSN|nr:hypothetical protein DOTSEDRAFT_25526 [Dothistroma septosporum NZE10]
MPPLPNSAFRATLVRQIDTDGRHTGTTGDSMSELSDSSAGRSAIRRALSSTIRFGICKPHSTAPIAVHNNRLEPLFGPSGSRVYGGERKEIRAATAKEPQVFDGGDMEDDGRNAMATLSAATLNASETKY